MPTISIAAAWFRRQDYDAVKALAPHDPNLPDAFDEWLDLATQQLAQLEAEGVVVEKVVVEPRQFAAWCRRRKVEPDQHARAAYAVDRARRQRGHRA